MLVGGLFAAVAQPAFGAGSCAPGVVRDYAQPFQGLPELAPVPSTNDLPFGPAQLRISEVAHRTVVTGESALGYQLTYGRDAQAPSAELNWTVAARLVRISPGEGQRRLVDGRVMKIGRLRPGTKLPFRVPVAARPSLYRIEIEFRRADGERIGRYGDYFRVLPPIEDLRLSLDATSYRAGEVIAGCLENLGTVAETYGACGFTVERFEAGVWSPYPPGPPRSCILIAFALEPGMVAGAGSFTIPADAPTGVYRAGEEGASIEFPVSAAT